MTEELKKETMEDYASELEASFRKIKEGDMIKGTVLSVGEEAVILDLRYYTQGIIKAADFSDDPHFSFMTLKQGDELEAVVISEDDGEGNILLSRKEASNALAWDVLKQYLTDEQELSVKISEVVKGGTIAYLEGVRGFIPASQLSLSYVEELEPYLGKELQVRVITVDQDKEKLVLSAKAVEKERAEGELQHKMSMLTPGMVLEGTVDSLMPYGAFVSLSGGMSGLVHISQICQRRIKKPSEVLNTGDKVKVKVLNTNNGKLSLSMKALEEDMEADVLDGREPYEYNSGEEATTTLGDLFAKLKL